jgi:hypothetical protein
MDTPAKHERLDGAGIGATIAILVTIVAIPFAALVGGRTVCRPVLAQGVRSGALDVALRAQQGTSEPTSTSTPPPGNTPELTAR